MNRGIRIAFNSGFGPIGEPTGQASTETCWRCNGHGEVALSGEKTPCGACLGSGKNPKPCPECGSREVKIAMDGFAVFWRCRSCGFCGPESQLEQEALTQWEGLPRT